MRAFAALACIVLAAVAVAGCTQTPADPTTTSPGSTGTKSTSGTASGTGSGTATTPVVGSCSVAVARLPAAVEVGKQFNYSVSPQCGFQWTSNHVGSHYGKTSTDQPSTTVYTGACNHATDAAAGRLPSEFTCTISEPGTYYLRGHLRLNNGGQQTDYWSPEHIVVAVANATLPDGVRLQLFDVPARVEAGRPFLLSVELGWPTFPVARSEHIGAHFGPTSTNEPSLQVYSKSCTHASGDMAGSYAVPCPFTEPGTVYVRGHARVGTGTDERNYWSIEVPIVIG